MKAQVLTMLVLILLKNARLMYNRFYKYLKENNYLYEILGIQSGYSTNNAIIQLVDKIFDSFEKEDSF